MVPSPATLLRTPQVIAAVRRREDMPAALKASGSMVFLLCGDINDLPDLVGQLQDRGKVTFVHMDLTEGLGHDRAALRFVARHIRPAGIISTRGQVLKAGMEAGLMAIQRLFVVDSQALDTGLALCKSTHPSALEVLPGILPARVVQKLKDECKVPVVSGGLLRTGDEIQAALATGVNAVSVSQSTLW